MQAPVFKGKSDEDPNTHLLRAEDWLVAEESEEWVQDFRYTLDGAAREWF